MNVSAQAIARLESGCRVASAATSASFLGDSWDRIEMVLTCQGEQDTWIQQEIWTLTRGGGVDRLAIANLDNGATASYRRCENTPLPSTDDVGSRKTASSSRHGTSDGQTREDQTSTSEGTNGDALAVPRSTARSRANAKRDIRGFILEMSADDAMRNAQQQHCYKLNYCSINAPQFCQQPITSWRDMYEGLDNRLQLDGRIYGCSAGDDVGVDFYLRPTTSRIYELAAHVASRMNCDEMLDYAKQTFGVGDNYEDTASRGQSGFRCDARSWKVTNDFTIEMTPDFEGNLFTVKLIDMSVVRENAEVSEQLRRGALVKPRL